MERSSSRNKIRSWKNNGTEQDEVIEMWKSLSLLGED